LLTQNAGISRVVGLEEGIEIHEGAAFDGSHACESEVKMRPEQDVERYCQRSRENGSHGDRFLVVSRNPVIIIVR
jgi:hypothetical protein